MIEQLKSAFRKFRSKPVQPELPDAPELETTVTDALADALAHAVAEPDSDAPSFGSCTTEPDPDLVATSSESCPEPAPAEQPAPTYFAGQQIEVPEFNLEEAIRLRADGFSIRALAQRYNLPKTSLHRLLQEEPEPSNPIVSAAVSIVPVLKPAVKIGMPISGTPIPPTTSAQTPQTVQPAEPWDSPDWTPDWEQEARVDLPVRDWRHIQALLRFESAEQTQSRIWNDRQRYILSRGGRSSFNADPQSAITHVVESGKTATWVKR